jgi:hypothetical protein
MLGLKLYRLNRFDKGAFTTTDPSSDIECLWHFQDSDAIWPGFQTCLQHLKAGYERTMGYCNPTAEYMPSRACVGIISVI